MFRRKYCFTVPIEKEVTRIDIEIVNKNWNISYILQFIDSARCMVSSLANLINNLSEGIHRIKCEFGDDDKKCETCGIKYKYRYCFLEYTNFKDDLIEYNVCLVTKIINTSLMKSWKLKFLSAPGLARQAALNKTEVKLDFLTYLDMLLMVEKGIRGGICLSIYRYA